MTKKWGHENSWIFGSCANSQTYKSKQIYTEKCCQLEGEYELICKDSFGDGWHGGYLEIDGTKYCTDFKQGSEQATEAPMSGMQYYHDFLTIWKNLQYHLAFHSKLINFIIFMQGQLQHTTSTLAQNARMDFCP